MLKAGWYAKVKLPACVLKKIIFKKNENQWLKNVW